MMHPAPIRARSRTWDWFQMLVPSPICASGATSAVGWMRTDGRSFMRSPALRRFYPAGPQVHPSSRAGREGTDRIGRRGNRATAVTQAVLLLRRELRGGEARRELEDRVVPEAAAPTPLRGHRALD